jgi:hypothetical protein
MKKIIKFLISIFLILAILSPSISCEYLNGDEVDQQQNLDDGFYWGIGCW